MDLGALLSSAFKPQSFVVDPDILLHSPALPIKVPWLSGSCWSYRYRTSAQTNDVSLHVRERFAKDDLKI